MRSNDPATWFRLYAEFATDPKVQMLNEADQRRFIMLLCVRCSSGNVTLHDDELAFQMRISVQDWCATKATLVQRGLIDDGNLPLAWAKRQRDSDSSTERVAKHRSLKKQLINNDLPLQLNNETEKLEPCNRDVTLQQRSVETETERELTPITSSLRSEVIPPQASKKITFKAWLALLKTKNEKPVSDYKPVWDYVAATGLSEEWVHIAWVQFSDRYLDANNSRKRYIDWRQVFLNAIKGNWFRLWYFKDGVAYLSTVGQQADLETLEPA